MKTFVVIVEVDGSGRNCGGMCAGTHTIVVTAEDLMEAIEAIEKVGPGQDVIRLEVRPVTETRGGSLVYSKGAADDDDDDDT